ELAFRPITEVVPGVPYRPQGEGRNYSGHVALVSQRLWVIPGLLGDLIVETESGSARIRRPLDRPWCSAQPPSAAGPLAAFSQSEAVSSRLDPPTDGSSLKIRLLRCTG
ncbi:unnamed protein product, partial [Nesidiocoris tenuis]